jgi:hypothetical protein
VKDYFPLRVGDSWKYRSTVSDAEATLKVVSEEKQADGSKRFLVQKVAGAEIQDWYSKTAGWVLHHREAYVGHQLETKYDPPKQLLRNPLITGATWKWSGRSITQNEVQENHEVMRSEIVKVPAGTFRAIKLVSQITEGSTVKTQTSWYADGVGLLKYTIAAGEIQYGFELVDYSFKRAPPKK